MKILFLVLLLSLSACGKSLKKNAVINSPPAITLPPLVGSGSFSLVFNNSPDGLGGSIVTDVQVGQNLKIQLPNFLTANYFDGASVSELNLTVTDSGGNVAYFCIYKSLSGTFQRLNCAGTLNINKNDTLKINNIPMSGTVKLLVNYETI